MECLAVFKEAPPYQDSEIPPKRQHIYKLLGSKLLGRRPSNFNTTASGPPQDPKAQGSYGQHRDPKNWSVQEQSQCDPN